MNGIENNEKALYEFLLFSENSRIVTKVILNKEYEPLTFFDLRCYDVFKKFYRKV